VRIFPENVRAMTTDEVLDSLGRYTKNSKESFNKRRGKAGISRSILGEWLSGRTPPQKCALVSLAGFLRRAGYLYKIVERAAAGRLHGPPPVICRARYYQQNY
jgi:hypothetical protein